MKIAMSAVYFMQNFITQQFQDTTFITMLRDATSIVF